MIRAFSRRYGASPLHLAGHLAFFAAAGYALAQLLGLRAWVNVVAWLAVAVVAHDLVLLPVYSTLDRLTRRVTPSAWLPVINHIRVPVVLSGLLLLVFFPPILGLNGATFARAAGHEPEHYARDWVLLSLAASVASAVVYAVRAAIARRR